jgi:hypothetical protein
MTSTTPPLPEKGIFALFRQGGSLYFKSGKFLIVMTLLAYVPVFIFREFLPREYYLAYLEFFGVVQDYMAGAEYVDAFAVAAALGEGALMYAIMFLGIELAFFPLMAAAATYLAARHLEEQTPNFDSMFSAVLPRFPRMIFTTVLVGGLLFGMFYFLGGTLFVIFPIYFGITLIFFQNVAADLGRWGFSAMSISRFMVRGRWFRSLFMFSAIVAAYFLAFTAMDALGTILGLTSSPLTHLPYFLVQHFILSIFVLTFALWYFDIKRFHLQNLEALEKMIFDKMRGHIKDFIFEEKVEDFEEKTENKGKNEEEKNNEENSS